MKLILKTLARSASSRSAHCCAISAGLRPAFLVFMCIMELILSPCGLSRGARLMQLGAMDSNGTAHAVA